MTGKCRDKYLSDLENAIKRGTATVFVGAGFSRNARPKDPSNKELMPLWSELVESLRNKLDDSKKSKTDIQVADEFEAAYGRKSLDQEIIFGIRDNDYEPSDVHRRLLDIRWKNVLTTNYDTLLERANDELTDRNYRIVREQKDLSSNDGRPVIVKLHGTVPDVKPFIITGDDFRDYEQKFGIFVDYVKGIFTTETVCLIGFSGDDPNFKNWSQWVRERLQEATPEIYLITDEKISNTEKKLFEKRKIRIINLDDLGLKRFETPDKYRRFINRLYEDTKSRSDYHLRDTSVISDKDKDQVRKWLTDDELLIEYQEGREHDYAEMLHGIHSRYPGWIQIPYRYRKKASILISRIEWFFPGLDKCKRDYEDEICYEYCWINDMMGRPVSRYYISLFSQIIHRNKITEHTATIVFTLMRSCRLCGYEDEWQKLYRLISPYRLSVEDRTRLFFEDVYHDIFTFHYDIVEGKLSRKRLGKTEYEFRLRRAGILALFGNYDRAIRELGEDIKRIRGEKAGHDFYKLSIESSMVCLYNYIVQGRAYQSGQIKRPVLKEESDKNVEYDFDWDQENSRYADVMNGTTGDATGSYEYVGFDIGSRKIRVKASNTDTDVNNAYEFLGFREKTGVPFRLGILVSDNGITGAAEKLSAGNRYIPLILAAIDANDDIIKKIYTRKYIAESDISECNEICNQGADLLIRAVDHLEGSDGSFMSLSFEEYPLRMLPELLSRLCTRVSSDTYGTLLDALVKLYNGSRKYSIGNISAFTERLIRSIPLDILEENMYVFWNLPLMKDKTIEATYFPECFDYIYNRICSIQMLTDNDHKMHLTPAEEKLFSRLLRKCDDEDYRKPAIRRLTYIFSLYDLSDMQKKMMRDKIIGDQNDDDIYSGDFYPVYFMSRPDGLFDSEFLNGLREKEWNKLLTDIRNASEDDSFTSYSGMLIRGISLIEHSDLVKKDVKDLSEVCVKFCNKLNCIRVNGVWGDFFKRCRDEGLKYIGKIIAESIISAGLTDKHRIYADNTISEIKQILSKWNIPHSQLKCCTDLSYREDGFVTDYFNADIGFADEASTALYRLSTNHIPVTDDVQELLVASLCTARDCKITNEVMTVEYLIRCGLLRENCLESVIKSLPRLMQLSEYVNRKNASEKEIMDSLLLRQSVSMLSHTIYHNLSVHAKDIPDEVTAWKKLAESENEFAEIRNGWDE